MADAVARDSPDEPSFADLIAAARGGDRGAIARLFDRSRGFLLGAARRRLRGPCPPLDTPSDLAQEAAAIAWRRLPDFAGTTEAVWRAWLSRIVGLAASNARRRARRGARLLADPGPSFDPAGTGTSPSSAAARGEEASRLREAVDGLDADDRAILVWREVEGLSFPEIGRRLGLSDVGARNRWKGALGRLDRRFRSGAPAEGR